MGLHGPGSLSPFRKPTPGGVGDGGGVVGMAGSGCRIRESE